MFKTDKIGWGIVIVLTASLLLRIWNEDLYNSVKNYRLIIWIILVAAILYHIYKNRQNIRSESPKYKDLSLMLKIALWMCFILITAVAVLAILGYLVS